MLTVGRSYRTLGCPYISSLKKAEVPSETQLILFLCGTRGPSTFQARREVLKDGHDLGHASINVYAPEVKEDEELWLYPYFNLDTKTLMFQKPDGTDHPIRRSLPRLAASKQGRPLLHLAHMEGLLDKVPGMSHVQIGQAPLNFPHCRCSPSARTLLSLSFRQVHESGYAIYSSLSPTGQATCMMRLTSGPSAQVRFYPAVEKDRLSLVFFPYIAEDGQLRLWDTEMDVPVAIRGRNGVQEGWDALTVRRCFPALFEFTQSLGHWQHVR